MPSKCQKLEELLKQGYHMMPALREHITVEEVEARRLPTIYKEHANNGTLKAAILQSPSKQSILYYFFDEDTHRFVRSFIDMAHARAKATVFVTFGISFLQLSDAAHYNLGNLLAAMRDVFGWDVSPSHLGHGLFDFLLVGQPADDTGLQLVRSEVERKLLLLSLLYRAGMHVHQFNVSIIPEGAHPFGVGPVQSASARFTATHLDQLLPIFQSTTALKAAHGLRAFYRQTTKVGRLALGWMLMEDLFGDTSEYPHILSKVERREVAKLLNEQLKIDVARKRRLIEGFNNRNAFRRSRNEIIAERIAALRNEDIAAITAIVKGVSEARGNVLHSFKAEDEIVISGWERFIEDTVLRYIVRESGAGMIRLRGD